MQRKTLLASALVAHASFPATATTAWRAITCTTSAAA